MGEMSKAAVSQDAWFEHFGMVAVGPIDGHDFPTLLEFLNEAKHFDRPMVLHVKTVKGKGFSFTENDPSATHSPGPFTVPEDMESEGCRIELKKSARSFTGAVGEALVDLMTRDPKVVVATAAMPDGTGVSKVMPKFPDRTFDTGICESHAMDMMAGMARSGWKPFFAVYSTFLQRAFDQAFQEVSLQGLAVRLLLDRAGLVGGDGAVHHGFCDIAMLATLPKAAVMAAMDEPSLKAAMEFMRNYESGLSSLRYPRDAVSSLLADQPCPPFQLGKARALVTHERPDAAVLGLGVMAIEALDAVKQLDGEYRVNVYDARFAKPVDADLLRDLLTRGVPVITVEDHSIRGGFGSCVLEACADLRLDTRLVTRLALPDHWIYQGERREQLVEAGLDAASIARAIRAAVEAAPSAPAPRPAPAKAHRTTGIGLPQPERPRSHQRGQRARGHGRGADRPARGRRSRGGGPAVLRRGRPRRHRRGCHEESHARPGDGRRCAPQARRAHGSGRPAAGPGLAGPHRDPHLRPAGLGQDNHRGQGGGVAEAARPKRAGGGLRPAAPSRGRAAAAGGRAGRSRGQGRLTRGLLR
jgi:transketolase C-terminal domain/subunit